MLIDLHAHSSGISQCCRATAEEVIAAAQSVGLDGLVLTNHYQKSYVTDGDYSAFARKYIDEYAYARQCGDRLDCRIFFGVEVTMEQYAVHLLLYGVDEEFVLNHPMMFGYSQEKLYGLVKESGGILIQAHPFRGNVNRLLDLRYLDGVEVNCHPMYEETHLAELSGIAARSGGLLTCGGDYHADTHRPRCGVYLPDHIQSTKEIKEYLCSADSFKLCVQETRSTQWKTVVFRRGKALPEL